MEKTQIESLENLKKSFNTLQNTNRVHHSSLSPLEKIALAVTEKIGTLGFFLIIFTWSFSWLTWNILAPRELKFDPYPAFVLWLFISNLIQLHLMPLIMIGQNIQGKHAELRAQHDFETGIKAEKEIEMILLHLENQQKLILEILKKL